MWAVPFLVTPPIFSRDVYSYLAIGAQMLHGTNPYELGPVDALGRDNPLAHQVDARWQHTTTPYGPGFLLIVQGRGGDQRRTRDHRGAVAAPGGVAWVWR